MYALAFDGTVWSLPVRPESIEVSYAARTAVAPTMTEAYVDMFGPGVGTITLNGTTGWGVGARKRRPNGLAALKQLIALYGRYLVAAAAASDPRTVRMTFADGYTGRSFLVVPEASGLRTTQNQNSPLIVRYSLSMIVLRDLSGGKAQGTMGATGVAAGVERGLLDDPATLGQSYLTGLAAGVANAPGLASSLMRYAVQAGDTLALIAEAYDTTPDAIKRANGIQFPSRIQPGLVLTIPQG